jgi:hypothetical protein
MLLLEFFDDSWTSICASVVDHNKFVIFVGLTENGLNTLNHIVLMIEAGTNDRDFWRCDVQSCFRKVGLKESKLPNVFLNAYNPLFSTPLSVDIPRSKIL